MDVIKYLVFTLALFAGCFDPKFKDSITCGTNGECPAGRSCGVDNICHATGNTTMDDAAIDIDAAPDAPPVECMADVDCQSPPDACSVAGVCDTAIGICVFQPRDCSSFADDCNIGTCEPSVGCVKKPAHANAECGAGDSCGAFGACGNYSSTCDSSGTRTRDCTMNRCQAGTCKATNYVDTGTCSRTTDGLTCMNTVPSNCGTCTGSSESGCADDGHRTCTCTSYRCSNDSCAATSSSCTQSCAQIAAGGTCSATASGCILPKVRDACCSTSGFCSMICSVCQ